jgi:hypothetical protein
MGFFFEAQSTDGLRLYRIFFKATNPPRFEYGLTLLRLEWNGGGRNGVFKMSKVIEKSWNQLEKKKMFN